MQSIEELYEATLTWQPMTEEAKGLRFQALASLQATRMQRDSMRTMVEAQREAMAQAMRL